MIDYFLNGIATVLGAAFAILILVLISELKEKIARNKRYGRKWWKL